MIFKRLLKRLTKNKPVQNGKEYGAGYCNQPHFFERFRKAVIFSKAVSCSDKQGTVTFIRIGGSHEDKVFAIHSVCVFVRGRRQCLP